METYLFSGDGYMCSFRGAVWEGSIARVHFCIIGRTNSVMLTSFLEVIINEGME
jgi:hypothetical protein